MLVGHRCASQLAKGRRCTASVTIKPGLQGVEALSAFSLCTAVFLGGGYGQIVYNVTATGFLWSVNLIRGQHWTISSYKSTDYLDMANYFLKRKKTDIRHPTLKYLNLGLFACEVPFLQSGFEENWLLQKSDGAQHKVLQRNEHQSVSLCALDSTPLVFFHSHPHSFIVMSNSHPQRPTVTVPPFIKDNRRFASNFNRDRNKSFILYHPNT